MKVFLSHSTAPEDGPIASRVRAIASAYNTEVILPPREGKPLTRGQLRLRISKANVVIALITAGALQSNWVRRELDVARELSKPVIVLLESGLDPEAKEKVFQGLKGLPIIEFDRSNPRNMTQKLKTALQSIFGGNNSVESEVGTQREAPSILAFTVMLLSLLFLASVASRPDARKHAS